MPFARYIYKSWGAPKRYTDRTMGPVLPMKRRRFFHTPLPIDKIKIRRREEKEWIENKIADGKPLVTVEKLPPWRMLQVDRRHCLPQLKTGEENVRIAGVQLKVPDLEHKDYGFPTHFKKY